jgi:hypothetical protein
MNLDTNEPALASYEIPIRTTLGAPSLRSKGGKATNLSHRTCHPENPRVGGFVNNTSCSWGKRGEGSAVQAVSIDADRS